MSDTLTAVFDAESTSSSVSFPVLLDDLVESNETFDLQLFVPQTQSIRTGSPSIARAIIIDSTGITSIELISKLIVIITLF